MAIPSIPTNFYVQTGNQQNYLTWNGIAGATSYQVQRSLDGVNFTNLTAPVTNSYVDSAVTIGVQYWYQVASINLSGTSGYTAAQSVVPAPTSEMSLGQVRQLAQMRADRVGSNFVTVPEWNSFINLAMYELYDLLIKMDEDYAIATPAQFVSQANSSQTFLYPLPNGTTSFLNGITGSPGYIAPPFYKLKGIDLGLNTANNAWVTTNKFNFIKRNAFVYPNTASTIYGVFNLRYRVMGNNIMFIPTPSAGQNLRIWYIPRLPQLLLDTDLTTIGISGWLQYVIIRAAKYALDKEESDTTKLDQELVFIKSRVEEASADRDAGQPDTVSDIRSNGEWGSQSGGAGGAWPMGGM